MAVTETDLLYVETDADTSGDMYFAWVGDTAYMFPGYVEGVTGDWTVYPNLGRVFSGTAWHIHGHTRYVDMAPSPVPVGVYPGVAVAGAKNEQPEYPFTVNVGSITFPGPSDAGSSNLGYWWVHQYVVRVQGGVPRFTYGDYTSELLTLNTVNGLIYVTKPVLLHAPPEGGTVNLQMALFEESLYTNSTAQVSTAWVSMAEPMADPPPRPGSEVVPGQQGLQEIVGTHTVDLRQGYAYAPPTLSGRETSKRLEFE